MLLFIKINVKLKYVKRSHISSVHIIYLKYLIEMEMHLRVTWEIRLSTMVTSTFSAIFFMQASLSVEMFFLLASSWKRKWSFKMLTTAATRHIMTRGLKNTTRHTLRIL